MKLIDNFRERGLPGIILTMVTGTLTLLLAVACDLNGQREQVTTNIYHQSTSLDTSETQDFGAGFQAKDTVRGWFFVSNNLKIDFFAIDTHNFQTRPHDAAHSLVSALQKTTDTFLFTLPAADSVVFELSNTDPTAGRAVMLHVDRVYWRAATGP